MPEKWVTKKVLITVRTYPTPSKSVNEASCTAGICEGNWIRLFPVPYRLLDNDKRFRKYQYIEVRTIKPTSDVRPESYKIDPDSIKILTEPLTRDDNWRLRKSIVLPLKSESLCSLYAKRKLNGFPTLGLVKPSNISKLQIKANSSDWSPGQKASLAQSSMLYKLPERPLEKIPYSFYYEFDCGAPNCSLHRLSCLDWEMGESYLKWVKKFGNNWENKFLETYSDYIINKRDTHFFVGTVHDHPDEWVIIGLFYPPKNDDGFQPSFSNVNEAFDTNL